MRTYVRVGEATILHADLDAFFASVEQRDDPRLRGRPVIVGGGRRARRELRGEGARRPHRDGRRAGAPALPAARSSCAPRMSALLRGEQGGLPRSSTTRRRSSRGSRSTRRSSTSRGLRRLAGTPAEIAARLRRDVRERVGLPITVGVARTKFLAKVASGVAKPDGLLVVPPDGELAFLHPLPVERLWGVGPVTARQAPRRAGSRRSAQVARARRGGARRRCSAARPGGTCTRSPTTATRGRCRSAAGAARSGRSARSAGAREVAEAIDAVARRARRPRHPPHAGRAAASAAPSCCGCASTTSRARPARTRCRSATAAHADDPRHGARAARGRACR